MLSDLILFLRRHATWNRNVRPERISKHRGARQPARNVAQKRKARRRMAAASRRRNRR